MIYLIDDVDATVERILSDQALLDAGLGKRKVLKTLKSFQGDEIASSVFLKKYALRDENNKIVEFTLEEAKERWANAIMEGELSLEGSKSKEYFRELYNYLLPAGRQMYALGNAYIPKATYSNCYVTKIEDDSIEGIYDAAKRCARTYSYGGGIGLCIGELRPNASKVSNSAGQSTGAVSFMDLFSHTTGLIGQSGRRGALLLSIPVNHPDIEEFIDVKKDDLNKVRHANISVKITDNFLKAVEKDEDFELSFITKHEEIKKTVRAKDLWNKIISSAHKAAEPGILFWDRMVEQSPSEPYESLKVHCTNPCFSGDMKLLTENGYVSFEELSEQECVNIVQPCGSGVVPSRVWCSGIKPVFEIKFHYKADIPSIKCTSDHVFMLNDGTKCKAKYLRGKRIMPHFFHKKIKNSDALLAGFIQGDGNTSRMLSKAHHGLEINIGKNDSDVADILEILPNGGRKYYSRKFKEVANNFGLKAAVLPKRELPDKYIGENLQSADKKEISEFLCGLFSANGSVISNTRVVLKTTCFSLARQVKKALSFIFGIESYITTNKEKEVQWQNGNFIGKESYDLNISRWKSLVAFAENIGFIHNYKVKSLNKTIVCKSPMISAIKFVGKEKVYDFNEPEKHWGIVEGFVAHNCGEIVLEKGGACVLSSLLLTEFVNKPFTSEASFNFELFKEMVGRGVRHLDNVVEMNLNKHPLEEQRMTATNGRRIGLGITGLADMLVSLNIQYDSQEALDIIEKIMQEKMRAEYLASAELAQERGSFPLFDSTKHFERGFCKSLPEDVKEVCKNGLRNVTISTIPPNGSLSIMAQCSSGLEPIYALKYKRFVEMGEKTKKQFWVFHQGMTRFFNITKQTEVSEIWREAHQIDYNFRVKMQGLLQKYIDSSISSTINLPSDVSVETVGQIYIDAWKEGLKGVTVYREGSREGILVTDDYAKEAGIPDMDSVTYKVRAEGGDKFYIIVSYRNADIKQPYQVFVLNYKQAEKDSFIKIGNQLVKMLQSSGVSEERLQKYLDRSKSSLEKLTRFLSLSMKTDNIDKAVDILNDHAFVGTLAYQLYNIFSKSLVAKKSICKNPDCQSSNVRMEEGCMVCVDCGWSGCS